MDTLMTRIAACCAFSTLLLIASVEPTEACSCIGPRPPCEAFWSTPVVFSATVLDITDPANPSKSYYPPYRRVRMQVERAWRGDVSGVIEIRTGAGGGDCGYDFKPGVAYLVYAYQRGAELSANICSRTKPLAEAAEDLAYFKMAFDRSAAGRIVGSVKYQRQGTEQPERPIGGYSVTLSSDALQRKTTTASDGSYEFRVPAGKYRIQVELPSTEHAYGSNTVELMDPRGCASADFYVVADGRIATRVVDAGGKPVRGIRVEFVKVDSLTPTPDRPFPDSRPVATDDDGRAEATQLAASRYVIGINVRQSPDPKQPYPRLFYPGVADASAAHVVDLQTGERVELDAFVLPVPLAERRITGIVVWPDGSPAQGANVGLNAERGTLRRGLPVGSMVTADREGRFTLIALAGRRYHLTAYMNVKTREGATEQWSADSPDFDADAAGGAITLTLAPPSRR